MTFRVTGLSAASFQHLFGLSDKALAGLGVQRRIANQSPGFPDRIELRDAAIGEPVLLLNYTHQPANTPYHASHAIFILEGATTTYDRVNEIPDALRLRTLSLRAFDDNHFIVNADLTEGRHAGDAIERLLSDSNVAYIQAHYAKHGCYAARIERV